MKKVKVLKEGLTVESAIVDVDAVIQVEDGDFQRLVDAGYVEAVETEGDDVAKKLDKIKLDDLKVKAATLGMEVADDIKKADLIKEIIEAGKADAFLA